MPRRAAVEDDPPAGVAGAIQQLPHHLGHRTIGADRIAGDDRRLADDPVGDHPARGELKALVRAQDERRERVIAVSVDNGSGAGSSRCAKRRLARPASASARPSDAGHS